MCGAAGSGSAQFIEHSTLHCEAPGDGGGLQMIPGTILTVASLLLGLLAAQPGAIGVTVTRLVEQDEVIVKVPIQPRPFAGTIEWREHKGPKCIPVGAIERAFLSGSRQIDFALDNGRRMRAELDDDCPALDFYGGFYLQLQDDQLCAGRDAIRSRMGGSCTIERFRKLVPKLHEAR